MKKTTIASVVALVFTSPVLSQVVFAAEQINLDEVTVKANRFEHKDTETTYASEIHTAKQIEDSGAATLYDFLAQQTSLNVLSNFGSRATPSINLRGFGGENGYQNVVITIDGQRLNNVDQVPQLLGAIPLGNIERIEISKGSGSVIYGDGATAGAIQIYTKNKTGVTVSTSFGNFGQQNHYINAGISEQYIDLSASLARDSDDGFSNNDASGHKDEFTDNTQNVKLKIKPTDSLRLFVEGTSSRNDIRYVSPLTRAQFDNNPRNVGLNFLGNPSTYTHQSFGTDQWRVGTEYEFTKELKLSATHFQEDKESKFPTFAADYDYSSNDIALSFQNERLSAIVGYQDFDGDRIGSTDVTKKYNKGTFAQAEYQPVWLSDVLTISAGIRHEKINYRYAPTLGNTLEKSDNLNAWDIGANYKISPELSMFTNYNKAFQAPDIDRFFRFDSTTFQTVFNGYIKPARIKTFNIGLNHVNATNHLKATAFYSKLNDEIYLDPTFIDPVFFFSGINSNADKTHKYGLEVQDYFNVTNYLTASIIYNYTRAIVDKETTFDGSQVENKDLPGVPKHTIVANLNYKFLEHATANLSHSWRSKAYVYNDFTNNASQKQDNYQSTNLALNYQYKNIQVFTSINNIFEHENNIQTAVDAIYPVDFVRTWRVGVKADF